MALVKKLISSIRLLFINKKTSHRPQVSEILETVCQYHKLSVIEVKSKSRKREYVRVRQQYCLMSILFGHTQETISDEINRDHSTAHNGKSRALYHYQTQQEYRNEITEIISKFPLYSSTLTERLLTLTTEI